jgi:hypothetical protein
MYTMLKRKYYAQYGHSGSGKMNTLSVARNTSSFIRYKRQCCVPHVQNVQDRTAAEKIDFIKTRTLQCATTNGNNPSFIGKSCSDFSSFDKTTTCPNVNIAKNVKVAVDQNQQINNIKSAVNCVNGNYWGQAPVNNAC